MQLIVFAFAALASVVASSVRGEWPKECKYTDGESLCYDADARKPIVKESYEYSRVHMRLPLSSGFAPQPNTEDGKVSDPWRFEDRCFCFRSLTEEEIGKASPVDNMRDDVCQYHSIRCLRRVELGDVPSCAESYFRCKDPHTLSDRTIALREELCQRFKDINKSLDDAIVAVTNVKNDDVFTPEDETKKLATLESNKKEFDTRRELSCEGTKSGMPVADPKTGPTGN
ncbi:hypothetical protein BGZ92_008282 [Podila epicladia]|nr:hypothetical protein BGZ92_008282 [Podila epicladia]